MHITIRNATVADIPRCLSLIPLAFVCDPRIRACFPEIWREWLQIGCLLLTVLENQETSLGERIVAFGSSLFITQQSADRLRSGQMGPGSAAHMVHAQLLGQSPALIREEIRRGNSTEGLNLLVTHIGWDRQLSEEEQRSVKYKILEAYSFTHGGYNTKEVLQEVYSEAEMRRGLAIGAKLRSDYSEYYRLAQKPVPSPAERPYLIGCTRAEVVEGSALAPSFLYSPPKYRFKAREQEILLAAMEDKNDEEIASTLFLSKSTVQKSWLAIYDHVAEMTPYLLLSADKPKNSAGRGAEKKRYLLKYLSQHLEELRPHLDQRGKD